MKRRILIVDADPTGSGWLQDELGSEFEIHTALDAGEACELCRDEGPFSAIVSTRTEDTAGDAELLAVLGSLLPDTPRLLVGGEMDPQLLRAVENGDVFRVLTEPLEPLRLVEAVRAAVVRFVRFEEERLLTEQLAFSREALEGFTRALEDRLERAERCRRELRDLAEALNHARSMEEVAQHVARVASTMTNGRGTHVVFEDELTGDVRQATFGPALGEGALLVPFPCQGTEVGHLRIEKLDARRRELGTTDREMLDSIARFASLAGERHLLRGQRDTARRATVHALARLAEHRDDETGMHLQRVSEYSRLIAEGLRASGFHQGTLSDSWIEDLVGMAPLHDIGKVGIPDSILMKPGPLAEEEWSVMRQHPTIGADTIRRVLSEVGNPDFLQLAIEIVESHHEKWDGSGYPRGLVMEEIPLSARIVALADFYDALTSCRPYKEAWSHEKALDEVKVQRGRHFDPRVVDVFVQRAGRVDEIRRRLLDPS